MSENQSNKINSERAHLEMYNGVGKASGKPFECLKVVIGDYTTLVFPSKFEMDYIKKYIQPIPTVEEAKASDKGFLD